MSVYSEARDDMRDSLAVGEVLHEATDNEFNSKYGYFLHSVEDSDGNKGESVYLELPEAGDCVEAVSLVGDKELRVKPISGSGWLVIHRNTTDKIHAYDLSAGDNERVIRVLRGDQYGYINTDNNPLIVRDDAPGFVKSDEVPADSQRLIKVLHYFSDKF